MADKKAHASPTKEFFVHMITKDILLEDCILDLLDNCLDGARKSIAKKALNTEIMNYGGFKASISIQNDKFVIEDNCGGISISEAVDYAFHFGRRPGTPSDGDFSIGLYGIGMKRAIFKMGSEIFISSTTTDEEFATTINVPAWLKQTSKQANGSEVDDWDFTLSETDRLAEAGTRIEIHGIYPTISAEFSSPAFINNLSRIIARDYAQFLMRGFEVILNGSKITHYPFAVRESEDFSPIRDAYQDAGVSIEIIAGMAGIPPQDLQPTPQQSETNYFGWYVLCNDRVVVAADKTIQTVWGDGGFPGWHYQYNGFIGVISFSSKDPTLLPWKTTKRDVDTANEVYRRAVVKMKETTRTWIDYTNDRKADLDEAKKREIAAKIMPLFEVKPQPVMRVAQYTPSLITWATVSYSKPISEISKVKKTLGNANMTNKDVGIRTFEYFFKNEVEE